jgi:hypothetical protein
MTASLLQDDWLGDTARSPRVIHADFAQSNPEILEAVVHEVVQPVHEDCDNLAQFAQDFAQPAQPSAQSAQDEWFTAQQIADRYPDLGKSGNPLQEGAIRTRWWDWVGQTCSTSFLKDSRGFTRLASDLFDDFATHCKYGSVKPTVWVEDAKARFRDRLNQISHGAIDGELMPEEVGGVLAVAQNRVANLTQEASQGKQSLLAFIEQVKSARGSLSETEIEAARQRGAKRAVEKFQVELQVELQTDAELRRAMEI